jgi:ketosteroid isomerase-like protein
VSTFSQFGAAAARNLMARDIVLEYPGDIPFAGTHRGRDAVTDYLRDLSDRSGGTHRVRLLGIEREAGGLLVRLEASLGKAAEEVSMVERVHLRFERGLVSHVRAEFEDQARWDAFWRPRTPAGSPPQ